MSQPHFRAPIGPPPPDPAKQKLFSMLGFYGIIYLVLLFLVVVGYPLAQQYAKPLARFIFPINENNSWVKNILVMSAMYWGMVGFFIAINFKQLTNKDD
jgi:hypothetical protein